MVGHFDFLSLDVQPRIAEGKEIIAIYFRGGGRGTLRSGEEGKNTIKIREFLKRLTMKINFTINTGEISKIHSHSCSYVKTTTPVQI